MPFFSGIHGVTTTTFQGKLVWKQPSVMPFKNSEMTYLVLRPKASRIDEVRIDITKHQPMRRRAE